MATKPKAILSTMDNREASPITRASNVLFENGQTVQDILNDRQDAMISPVIENSSSMFKVGQGDNVDYSSNVVNGAYESMVLKGKSMVNCIQEPSSKDVVLPYAFEDGQYVTINDTKESGALGVELKGQTLVNLVKGENKVYTLIADGAYKLIHINLNTTLEINKKYYLSYKVITNTIAEGNFGLFVTNGSDHCGVHAQAKRNETGTMTYVGDVNKVADKLRVFAEPNCVSGTFEITDVMLIEYQKDMENLDIPYFTGMTSCKMPILKTVGKNLFNHVPESLIGKTSYGMNVSISNGKIKITGTPTGTYGYVEIVNCVEKGKQYTFSAYENGQLATSGYRLWVRYSDGTLSNPASGGTFVVKNLDIVRVEFVFEGFTVGTAVNKEVNIQIEESPTQTSYETHKSSILSLPEEVVLRSLPNGVCDTFNTRTGEYVQRIGEITLDGNTRHTFNNNNSDNVNVFYFDNIVPNKKFTGYAQESQRLIQCDSLKTGLNFNRWDSTESEYSLANSATGFWIFVPKSIPQSWLSQNPVKLQYELEAPIVTKINLPSTLKSWNTTTHIYSEIPENSLYPILSHSNPTYPVILKPSTKYSIVANSYSNDHTNSTINFNLGGATASTTVGNRVTTITTPSTLSNELLTMSGRGNKLNNVMVIEGDVVGDEPYFEGMCDSKSPILSNVGKNLCYINDYSITIANNNPSGTHPNSIIATNIPVKTNTRYKVCFDTLSWFDQNVARLNVFIDSQKTTLETSATHSNLYHQVHESGRGKEFGGVTSGSVITTDSQTRFVHFSLFNMTNVQGKTVTFNNISLIEESTVLTDYEPYKSNILSCNGDKIELTEDMFEQGTVNETHAPKDYNAIKTQSDGRYFNKRVRLKSPLPIKPNTTYIINVSNNYDVFVGFCLDGVFLDNYIGYKGNAVFTTPSDCNEIALVIKNGNDEDLLIANFSIDNIRLSEVDKTIVLRSLPNGVCDTLNVETGEYVQRIGEVVLDGSELWSQGSTQSNGFVRFYASPADKKHPVANVMSSDIAPYNGITPYGVVGYENVTGYSHNIHLNINVKMERIGATDIAETKQNISLFQQWLSQNPITVQYELETPIIKMVDIQGFPFSYENGHVQLSSGSIEQSLTPKVEYSVATNRNGQIRSNQKMVERHQKQLDQLQAIILANLVNSQYNQTLTTLKYELSRV